MNNFCRKIQLPFDVKLKDFPFPLPSNWNTDEVRMFKHPITKVDPELLRFLAKHKVWVNFAEIFYTPPFSRCNIHVDTAQISNMTKLNLCICHPNSVMNWYEPLPDFADKKPSVTELTTAYLKYKKNEVKLLHSECISGWTIVNAGIPHDGENPTEEVRWTLSHSLMDLSDGKRNHLQFEKAVEIFQEYIQ